MDISYHLQLFSAKQLLKKKGKSAEKNTYEANPEEEGGIRHEEVPETQDKQRS